MEVGCVFDVATELSNARYNMLEKESKVHSIESVKAKRPHRSFDFIQNNSETQKRSKGHFEAHITKPESQRLSHLLKRITQEQAEKLLRLSHRKMKKLLRPLKFGLKYFLHR